MSPASQWLKHRISLLYKQNFLNILKLFGTIPSSMCFHINRPGTMHPLSGRGIRILECLGPQCDQCRFPERNAHQISQERGR